ncbi:acyl-CoA dehydrogenase family protein [Nocardia bovistercoris]|uniref:Acyl-CoA/acyl-ACP dehydrogenase n=1 Tax=Nocardia bovistercoris TaxID=2785916 RepID=A0A931IGA3_9NOCA|nr:acyl-CoA dehydrogenase family protein [Nocardia bovistercoris]MBH0780899.1 acyl-CoA/acyl-ACP dehydrogenase [Nocardia bovistercoris]
MTENQRSLVERARRIAEEVLYPDAAAVDRTGQVPAGHWEVLAEAGLYGASTAGLELPDIVRIIEILSGSCLSTAFVWLQHHGAVLSLSGSANARLRETYLTELTAGRKRAGAAFAGAVSQPGKLWAERVEGGYRLTGDAPFVSGWGIIDVVQVASRATEKTSGDTVVSGLIDAASAESLTAVPTELVAGQGTSTVRLRFDDHFLPDDRVTGAARYEDFLAFQHIGSRLNGAVTCGVAERAIRVLEQISKPQASPLWEQLDAARSELDRSLTDPAVLQSARARASELALRSAAALVAATGAPALLADQPAQRLLREATFGLVAASRPEMRSALVTAFTGGGRAG